MDKVKGIHMQICVKKKWAKYSYYLVLWLGRGWLPLEEVWMASRSPSFPPFSHLQSEPGWTAPIHSTCGQGPLDKNPVNNFWLSGLMKHSNNKAITLIKHLTKI